MEIDWTDWPLLRVCTAGVPDAEVSRVVGDALAEALERGEAFAAVVETPQAAIGRERPRGRGALERVRLVRRLRPGLAERCRGLAFVLPAASIRANARALTSGAKIWGCPTTATDDPEHARAWARERLGS